MRAQRFARVAVAAAGVLALGSLARADAPPDQYGLFNWDSEVIQDVKTRLTWQRDASALMPADGGATLLTFDGAAAYCAALSLSTYANGWRVPSYKELLTLVDESPHLEYEGDALVSIAIDRNAFPQTAVDESYWTSSPYLPVAGEAYAVDFGTGVPVAVPVSTPLYVRCVHD